MQLTTFAKLALAALASAPLAALSFVATADDKPLAPREVPAKSLPVPTDVSPGMQQFIAAPLNPDWNNRRGVARGGGQDGRGDRADYSGYGRTAPRENRAVDNGRSEGLRRDA